MDGDRLKALEDGLQQASRAALGDVALQGLRAIWLPSEQVLTLDPDLTTSLDAALQLIVRTLPGWAITLEGSAHSPEGGWSCMLRRSGLRDDEEVIGVGRAATAPVAVVVALLRVMINRAKGYT